MIGLAAQQYLDVVPRHTALVQLKDGGITVAAVSSHHTPSICFLEWTDAHDPQSHSQQTVYLPGEVTALAFATQHTVAGGGTETLDCLMCVRRQCSKSANALQSDLSPAASWTYEICVVRRFPVEPSSDDENDDEVSDSNPLNQMRRNASYRLLPTRLTASEGRNATAMTDPALQQMGCAWTTACRISPSKVIAACGGVDGLPNGVRTVRVEGTRLVPDAVIPLPGLAGLPVKQIQAVVGDPNAVRVLCHHSVMQLDLRMKQQASVVALWKWTPHDLLTCFTAKDVTLAVGTEDGSIALWDLRRSKQNAASGADDMVDRSAPYGSPVAGIHMPHSTVMHSCHADGSVWEWNRSGNDDYDTSRSTGTGFLFTPQLVSLGGPLSYGAPGCVGLSAADSTAIVADESGTISILCAQ